MKIVLIGCGALGSQICLELTGFLQSSISTITLVDPDILQAHNVPHSEAWISLVRRFSQRVIGNSKTDLLAQYCQQLAPDIQWESIPSEIADVGWKLIQEADIIITATDSLISRIETAYAARMLDKPMLDGGVWGQGVEGGRVAWHARGLEAACYACNLSTSTRSAALEHMASSSLSCSSLPLSEAMSNSLEGVSSVALIAKVLVQQLQHISKSHRSYTVRLSPEGQQTHSLSLSAECPWHHRVMLLALDDDKPIRHALQQNQLLLLPWAMALTSVCDACGTQQSHPVRVAKLRQNIRCPHCSALSLRPGRVIDRIAYEDEIAANAPRQIGLPMGNVFPVRNRIQPLRTFLNV